MTTQYCLQCSVAQFKVQFDDSCQDYYYPSCSNICVIYFRPNSRKFYMRHSTFLNTLDDQRTVRDCNTYDGPLYRFRSTKLWITPDGVRGYSFKTTLSSTKIVFGWTNILRGWKKESINISDENFEKIRYQKRTSFFLSTISLISPSQPWMGLVRLL